MFDNVVQKKKGERYEKWHRLPSLLFIRLLQVLLSL